MPGSVKSGSVKSGLAESGPNWLLTPAAPRWTVRISGLLALLLGLGLWKGAWVNLLNVHQVLGVLMTVGLLWLAAIGLSRRLAPGLSSLALIWSAALLAVGTLQGRLLSGSSHWVAEVIHLLLGLGGILLAELIASRLRKPSATG